MKYETVLIITPSLSSEKIKFTTLEYINYLIINKANLMFEEHWGVKKLAYPIKKNLYGCYHIFYYSANTKLIYNLDLKFKRDEKIIRFLTVKIDNEALSYYKFSKKDVF
ncbi:30S ribosomal protein S6 [Candidatus Karelsulcia muelleri]|uniref:30S ribosomal protein S6 n=1 Tax=Candidatus Karelsulcia muelleri TaxID=336810 RepID=UPI003CCA9CB7